MTHPQRRSLYSLIIWGTVAVVFLPLFLVGNGPEHWTPDGSWGFNAALVLFGFGFAASRVVEYSTKSKPGQQDERDKVIQGQASITALTVVMAYVFGAGIWLYVQYEGVNAVPVGWLWFLGYSTFVLGMIADSSTRLYYYSKGLELHGE